jgi:hypothetical protein
LTTSTTCPGPSLPGKPSQVALALYLAALVLLPWAWFPPFPWLHEHAQWSDAVFAAAAVAWGWECWQNRRWPARRFVHLAMGLYLGAAVLSDLMAPAGGRSGWKLLGMAELCALAFITEDMASRPGVVPLIARAVTATSLAAAAAALAGLVLFYRGIETPLVGAYGSHLVPSGWYARVQAGLYHPNLLASYCIFAAAVVARADTGLPCRLRGLVRAALWIMVVLAISFALLGFTAAAVLRAARTPRGRLVAGAYAAACAALLVFLTAWNVTLDPAHPLGATLDTSQPSPRWQARASSWETLAARPLWGCGPGASPGWLGGEPVRAHLTPLDIAATLGLPALLAFAGIVVGLWCGRSRPLDTATWSGLGGLALDALASDIEYFRHLWVLFGLAAARSGAGAVAGSSGTVSRSP